MHNPQQGIGLFRVFTMNPRAGEPSENERIPFKTIYRAIPAILCLFNAIGSINSQIVDIDNNTQHFQIIADTVVLTKFYRKIINIYIREITCFKSMVAL